MKSEKCMRPGQRGTKKWVEKYGSSLLFVRYRYNTDRTRRYTTVEIIVDEAERKIISGRNPANKLVFIRVLRHERYIQRMIKSVGAHWKPRECLWEIPFREVMALGLEDRIVKGK